jgi:hypothetical protein
MANIDAFHLAWALSTSTDTRLGGIAFSYFSTLEKVIEVSQIDWRDEALGRFENKIRMKEVGGAAMSFSEFLHENSILALAKIIEDTSIDLKRDASFKFDVIKEHHDVLFLKELQTIKALANVIKHNVSVLERKTSKSAKFLVDECGMANGWDLYVFIHSGHECFDIVEYIPKVYLAIMDLIEKAFGERDSVLDLTYDEAFNNIYELLLPEVLNVQWPKKEVESRS